MEHLSASAEQGNPFAQYALGMIYFFGNGVDEDKPKAIEWITKSADGGNEYAVEFLQKMADYNRQPSAFSSTINLLRHLSRIISNDYNNKHAKFIRTDKKEMQKIREKKESMGQKFE